ncbi:MAG: hypothetical protein K2N53_04155, partial [Clostridia bacterium]|nr:hypothetical protein [Clostridia bacterium]
MKSLINRKRVLLLTICLIICLFTASIISVVAHTNVVEASVIANKATLSGDLLINNYEKQTNKYIFN